MSIVRYYTMEPFSYSFLVWHLLIFTGASYRTSINGHDHIKMEYMSSISSRLRRVRKVHKTSYKVNVESTPRCLGWRHTYAILVYARIPTIRFSSSTTPAHSVPLTDWALLSTGTRYATEHCRHPPCSELLMPTS